MICSTSARQLEAEVGPPEWADAAVERTRGELAIRAGDLEGATATAEQALAGGLSVRGQARMWSLLGVSRYSSGDIDGAAEAFARELDAYEELGHDVNIATAHGNVAEVAMQIGDRLAAARHQLRCLELAEALGLPVMLAYSCILASRMAGQRGEWELAVHLQAGADAGLAATGHELYAADREGVDRFLDAASSELGGEVFDLAVEHGGRLAIGEATRLASGVLSAAAGASKLGHNEEQQGSTR